MSLIQKCKLRKSENFMISHGEPFLRGASVTSLKKTYLKPEKGDLVCGL